jgi:hypothetical protein
MPTLSRVIVTRKVLSFSFRVAAQAFLEGLGFVNLHGAYASP